ncbi:MAG: peptide-methionine (S)-S-oxide reductase, partial [Erysipelotrichaceae bacterium]|nr:peptide-methionine (S)-S-oxide reductase [Erysipelotrichaceae bacterium]
GEDEGTSYRTGIYYEDEQDKEIILSVTGEVQTQYTDKIVVEIEPLKCFYPAEEYHQKYLDKNPGGYCHIDKCFFSLGKKA